MQRTGRLIVAVLVAAALAACGGSQPSPKATSTPTPTPTASPLSAEIQQLAAVTAAATYTASYTFHQISPASTATVTVWHGEQSLRVDILDGGSTATLITNAQASYSCSITKKKRTCFRVATGGKPVPAPFDLAPQAIFSSDVEQLATTAASYDVTAAPPLSGSHAVPAAQCFAVAPTPQTPAPKVASGTYCFAAQGVLVAITYVSGNTVQLLSITSGPPAPTQFEPYASPTPVS